MPDADAPVFVNDAVLTFPINAAPSIVVTAQEPVPVAAAASKTLALKAPVGQSSEIEINIDEALISGQGWLAIHSDNNGQPGPVLAVALLHDGSNKNIKIRLDGVAAGTQVFPMLHYDTGVVGEYEFGTVPDADAPVIVNGEVVVVPLPLTLTTAPSPEEAATEPVEPAAPAGA